MEGYAWELFALRYELVPKLSAGVYDTTLYHYTSPSGLEGILLENGTPTFRFSRSDCLNDVSEGKEILSIYKDCVKKANRLGLISDEFASIVENVVPNPRAYFMVDAGFPNAENEKLPSTYISSEEYETYLCCFSKASDDLAMWNYYVKNGGYDGYCIGLQANILERKTKETMFSGCRMKFVEVIYSPEEKERIINAMINRVYDLFKSSFRGNLIEEQTKDCIADYLSQLRFWFKSDYFKHEQEVRMIIDKPKQVIEYANHPFDPIMHCRNVHGIDIPFFELSFDAAAVVSVMSGPTTVDSQSRELQIEQLKNKLISNYPGITLTHSNAPVRY